MSSLSTKATSGLLVGVAIVALVFGCGPTRSPDALDVVVISDSNGVGTDAWPNGLAERLRQPVGDRSETVVRLHNQSRRGRTLVHDRGGPETFAVAGVATWISRAIAESDGSVELVILVLGTNDLQVEFRGADFTGSTFGSDLASMLERIVTSAPEARTVLATPPPFCDRPDRTVDARWSGASEVRGDLDDAIRMAAERAGAGFVDLGTLLRPRACELLAPDGVHLNRLGHAAVAALLAEVLEGFVHQGRVSWPDAHPTPLQTP